MLAVTTKTVTKPTMVLMMMFVIMMTLTIMTMLAMMRRLAMMMLMILMTKLAMMTKTRLMPVCQASCWANYRGTRPLPHANDHQRRHQNHQQYDHEDHRESNQEYNHWQSCNTEFEGLRITIAGFFSKAAFFNEASTP